MPDADPIILGDKVRDLVTNFEGIVTARLEYIDGKIEFAVTPKSVKDNYPKPIYLPANQLAKVDGGVHVTRVQPVLGFHAGASE